MSPRTRLRTWSIAWVIIGSAIALAPLMWPWTNWNWLAVPAFIGCLIASSAAARRADRTYGWPMSQYAQAELDRRLKDESSSNYGRGWGQ